MASELIDRMAAGITQRKQEAATKLTPTAGERGTLPVNIAAPFPNDVPGMEIELALVEIERQANRMLESVAATRLALGGNREPVTTVADTSKEVEAQADIEAEKRKVLENLAKKTEEAQAAIFKTPDSTVEGGEDPTEPVQGWRCPTDPAHRAISKTSPRGRVFWKCTECGEFER